MTSPVYEPCVDSTGEELAPIVPVYPLSAGLSQKFISERVRTALGEVITESDILPASVLLENGLCTYSFAMRNIHFPENTDALERARRRLMFEQLFVLSASLCMKKAQRTVSVSYTHLDVYKRQDHRGVGVRLLRRRQDS